MNFRKILLILGLMMLFFPVIVFAADYGLGTSADAAGLTSKVNLMDFIASVIGTALSLIGVIFMVLFIYGGFLWMTASGDTGKTKKAKDLMTNAVIGAVLIFSAYFITKFVINELTGTATIQSGTGGATGGTVDTGSTGTDAGTSPGTGTILWD